jgi:outer membrane protein assembly factor BamB
MRNALIFVGVMGKMVEGFLRARNLGHLLIMATSCACIVVATATTGNPATADTTPFFRGVYRDGVLYTGAPAGRFVAVRLQSRQVIWTFQDATLDGFLNPAVTSDGVFLLAAKAAGETTEIIALNRATGRLRWRQPFAEAVRTSSPLACGGDLIEVDHRSGRIKALDATSGEEAWNSGGQPYHFFMPAAISGKSLYFIYRTTAESLNGGVAVLNCADGKLLRTIPIEEIGTSECPIILHDQAALLIAQIYDAPSHLMRLDLRTGHIVWRTTIPPLLVPGSCPAIIDNHLVSGSGGLWVVDLETGRTLAEHQIDESTANTAVYAGSIVFMAGERTLSAFRIEPFVRIWKTPLSGALASNIEICNDVLCVQLTDGELVVLDPTSGKVLDRIPLPEKQPTRVNSRY